MIEPTQFTIYDTFDKKDDLRQGDIIQPTKSIRGIFESVHKHFLDPKYTAFLVLTQSCDLVRRQKDSCKSKYINLAVVRPLDNVLFSLLDGTCERVVVGGNVAEGVYTRESKYKAKQLLERILNQNEQAMGLFYLQPDAGVRIAVPSVALLQVSIALRAREHYVTLVDARSGRLRGEFQSKLGWLIGNLFSRVATRDMPSPQRNELIDELLDGHDEMSNLPGWVDRRTVKAANKVGVSIEGLTSDQLVKTLEQHEPEPPRDVAIERALLAVKDVITGVSADSVEKIKSRLRNDPTFGSSCK